MQPKMIFYIDCPQSVNRVFCVSLYETLEYVELS